MDWLLALIQAVLFTLLAPLFSGWLKWVKCLLQNRRPPPPWQPYRDLRKLFGKRPVVADTASWLFPVTPYVVFCAAALSGAIVPFFAVDLPTAAIADMIVLVGFFALGRFFLALAGMDVGTAFGGMGSSREMTIASLAEPAMLMAIFTLALTASTTNISVAIDYLLDTGLALRPSFLFALGGLLLVAVAETGRIPIDNPATHLELTMIHEAMILEYSGRHLALIEWAGQIRLMLYGVLIANIFLPWGLAREFTPEALGIGAAAIAAKLGALAVALALAETSVAKMRLFRVQEFLGFAYLLSLLGMLSHIILEV
ncbi:respiratory chain complex I subunit 1 family protein [Methylococcus capsulatus]|jgi:formate hydrogenlyase subunit 4|uniref:Hydrogenase subunit n=1 Tax=Methylococcus capsulatus (strain ATCC 33009 / NCIMB 11132 / Bath) TaxID=243233 RepID=Q609T6_METCA|nr:NADH-quinone oxidoreductase subunit H [Methylococcus capsulatus]AAU92822.1 hydrogenase subunit [Methylococcus capsulatus str. Bath]QXP88130.1 NADH-quinone oxidoreductase subunit H [Methylococcus capsulatus]QXP94862.1 NADH-quinone oxidoreductase subunit H [Methylococcus capsulatus]UQN13161.1 NADH-quinone oxidoreductase subunit H [Methylococcus capsulatus]